MLDWVCWLGVAGDNLQFLHGECQIRAEISATIRTNGSPSAESANHGLPEGEGRLIGCWKMTPTQTSLSGREFWVPDIECLDKVCLFIAHQWLECDTFKVTAWQMSWDGRRRGAVLDHHLKIYFVQLNILAFYSSKLCLLKLEISHSFFSILTDCALFWYFNFSSTLYKNVRCNFIL